MSGKQLSKAELWALGRAIAESAKASACPRMRVFFEDDTVPSSDGGICVGDFGVPKKALRIDGGDADNRCFYLRSKLLDEGNAIAGLRLRKTVPVRWEARDSFTATRAYDRDSKPHARVGFWTPGFPTIAWKGDNGIKRVRGKSGSAWGEFAGTEITVVVGIDADDAVTCVIADSELDSAWFALGRTAVARPTAAQAKRLAAARTAREASLESDDRGQRIPAPRASAGELRAVATAIAAGPKVKAKLKRFSLAWDKVKLVPVNGKLAFGDPRGASFEIAAGRTEPKAVFRLYDGSAEDDLAWGRITLGVRLGPKKVVTWKPYGGVGVDSGQYGIWAPDDGLHGVIQRTAEGDGAFPSLLGLDANKQPVAFLLGEGLDPGVFGIRARHR
ncbi:MAG TPA: hypothetical protein VGC41_17015 [Kofleriaceae bacterium]